MHPTLKLLPGQHRRLKAGHPWIYANEVSKSDAASEVGAAVAIVGDNGETYGTALYNPHSLVVGRLVDRRAGVEVDAGFFADRLRRAMDLRDRIYPEPFYRLAHAEADGLPGLVVDRFGDAVVVQCNIAGMDTRRDAVLEALDAVVRPRRIVLRNDSPSRALEKLPRMVETIRGAAETPAVVRENGAEFLASFAGGQKTGWFYDQRHNRAFVAALSRGGRILDVYSYGGGFAIQALRAGATEAVLVDRSGPALEIAAASAARNALEPRCRFLKADAFAEMERLAAEGARFETVVADPPAFVKSRKDVRRGGRAYRKMTRLAARLVVPGGLLFVASCSHNVSPAAFAELARKGLADAGRSGRVLRAAGAGPDHPVHPSLLETEYLKSLTLQLD